MSELFPEIMNEQNRQRTLRYTQKIKGSPQEIFPLLCPNLEREWLDGWKYEMIHSASGFVEENCVFRTPMHGKADTYWMVSRYEPSNFIIEFVRFTPTEVIVKISIQVHAQDNGPTPVDTAYIYTALNEEQNEYLKNQLPQEFEKSMIWWERSMNYFLQTGKMLRHASTS